MENSSIIRFSAKDDGLNKTLKAIAKTTTELKDVAKEGKTNLTDLGESIPTKTFKAFDKTIKGTSGQLTKFNSSVAGLNKNYTSVIERADKANKIFEQTDSVGAKMVSSFLGVNKELGLFNKTIAPAAELGGELARAGGKTGKALVLVKKAGSALNPVMKSTASITKEAAERFEQMGGAASLLAQPLRDISQGLNKTQRAVKVASIASDLNLVGQRIKEFKEETLPELQEQLGEVGETLDKLHVKEMLFGNTMRTLNTTATVLSVTTKGLSKDISTAFLKFSQLAEFQGYFLAIANAVREVNLILKSTYQGFQDFQALGIDATMAEAALQTGFFGEKLLGSAQAAKQFRNTSLQAFTQLQDRLAYLTTLSTAAAKGQEALGRSLQDLVNGPLKNAISSLDVAVGYYDAISAGQESIEFLNASMKFSAATGATAADSIGALAQVHNIYRLSARDAAKTAALFNATIENGVINGEQMAAGIGQLASVGKAAGISVEELNAMIAALTKNGFSANDAFTGLMSLLNAIAGQGAESAKAVQELGIRFDFTRLKADGLMQPLQELYSATGGSVTRLKTIIPDTLAFQTAMALSTSAVGDFNDVFSQMENIDTDSLDDVFERRQDSIARRSQAVINGFREEMTAFGEKMKETMNSSIAAMEGLLETFRALPEPMKTAIAGAASLALQMDKVGRVFGVVGRTTIALGKAYLVARSAYLLFNEQGRQQLAIIIDLIKNQNRYGEALQKFLGISDKWEQKLKVLTGLQKAQLVLCQV